MENFTMPFRFRPPFSKKIVVVALVIVTLFALWEWKFPERSYHLRLTLNVEKNGIMHSGSSVVEINMTGSPDSLSIDGGAKWNIRPRGEAIFVDLGGGDNLVALLVFGPYGLQQTHLLPLRVILGDKTTEKDRPNFNNLLPFPFGHDEVMNKTFPVQLDQLPPMVRFRDINDPMTVERVDPADLTKSYGAGVIFRSARLEITNDPVTKEISQRLPWLSGLKPDKSLDGRLEGLWNVGEAPFSTTGQIGYGNFLIE